MFRNNYYFQILRTSTKDLKIMLSFSAMLEMLTNMKAIFIPIYLSIIGFSPIMVGSYLTISSFSAVFLNIIFSFLSDRYGRKRFLLINLSTSILCYLIPLFTRNYYLILFSAIFNRQGSRGSIINAMISEYSKHEERTSIFTIKLFIGSLVSIFGTLISGLPPLLNKYIINNEIISYMPLFMIGAILTLLCSMMLLTIKEVEVKSKETEKVNITRDQYRIILKLATTHSFDTIAVGITLSLFSLWFTIRYNVGIGVVSIVFTFAQFAQMFAYLLAPPIARRFGNVKGTVLIRALGALLIMALAFSPTPLIAAIMYAARNAVQRISHPLRQSYMMAILEPRVRASGAALVTVPNLVTSSVTPYVGGVLLSLSPIFPPVVSGVMFAIGDVLYWTFFKNIKPPEEQSRAQGD